LDWEKTWSRPEIAINSNPYKYAVSNEYDNLFKYCAKYGKSILPLIIEKLTKNNIFVLNLLKDLTYGGNLKFIDDITPNLVVEAGKPVSSLYSNLVDYSKNLLASEQDNMLKSIQDISMPDEDVLEANAISVNNRELLLNLYSENAETAFVKIYNIFGGLEHESVYNVLKGGQTTVIDVSNFKKGIYVIQITIGGKTNLQKISI